MLKFIGEITLFVFFILVLRAFAPNVFEGMIQVLTKLLALANILLDQVLQHIH